MNMNVSIGKTYFERDIMAVHITDRSVNGHKPKIYLQCLLHASMYVCISISNPSRTVPSVLSQYLTTFSPFQESGSLVLCACT